MPSCAAWGKTRSNSKDWVKSKKKLSRLSLRNASKERTEAREKLKHFDTFLGKISLRMRQLILPLLAPSSTDYSSLDSYELELIDYLRLQLQKNVTRVRLMSSGGQSSQG